jgi:hypothetical protein
MVCMIALGSMGLDLLQSRTKLQKHVAFIPVDEAKELQMGNTGYPRLRVGALYARDGRAKALTANLPRRS